MVRNILVAIGSPRKGGNTSMLAEAFCDGAREAGHKVTTIDVGTAHINGCLGCEYCFSHDGQCCQDDDMQQFYPLLYQCDTLVYATPIYCFTFTAQIKAFIDRMFCAIGKPFGIKETCLLTVFEDKDETISKHIIETYRVMTAYAHMKDVGVVAVGNTYEKGAIAGKPGLKQAYDLGLSLK